jgi:hypothetical protein
MGTPEMSTILKNHFSLGVEGYRAGVASGRYAVSWPEALTIEQIPATLENYRPLVELLGSKWHWDKQPRYNGASIEQKLENGALFLLKDAGKPVGYAFVSIPSDDLKSRFWGSVKANVIEIENLGMFPGQEGGGRGKRYFEMLFAKYFKEHDVVYWSQHETHSETLRRFYQEKMGMTLLAQDNVPDFRPAIRKVA